MDAGLQLTSLADPTRRAIFELICHAPLSVRQITDRLPVSQPAVSQHLKVLREARLVEATAEGARRIYTVDVTGLSVIRGWLDDMWDDVLDRFEAAAREERE